MVFHTLILRASAKRVPMIKFRKGGAIMSAVDQSHSQHSGTGQSGAAGASSAATARGPILEDWQLPRRYRRKEIDDMEIDYINRGGPA